MINERLIKNEILETADRIENLEQIIINQTEIINDISNKFNKLCLKMDENIVFKKESDKSEIKNSNKKEIKEFHKRRSTISKGQIGQFKL